jgi:hypothetical protein
MKKIAAGSGSTDRLSSSVPNYVLMSQLQVVIIMSLIGSVLAEDLFSSCSKILPFMNGQCWSQLIVKVLGIAIILGSFFSKAPVMINIINSKSSAGLSRTSAYGEAISTLQFNCNFIFPIEMFMD